MVTQLQIAWRGKISEEIKRVAKEEKVPIEWLRKKVSKGTVIILRNNKKNSKPLGIGEGLRTKINANIGTSSDNINPDEEIKKAKVAQRFGADTISDLSMGGDIDKIREQIFTVTDLPITTVPIYQSIVECGSFKNVDFGDYIKILQKQINQGVNSVVVHAGFTKSMLESLRDVDRIMGMVSKGGALTAAWIIEHGFENPYRLSQQPTKR